MSTRFRFVVTRTLLFAVAPVAIVVLLSLTVSRGGINWPSALFVGAALIWFAVQAWRSSAQLEEHSDP